MEIAGLQAGGNAVARAELHEQAVAFEGMFLGILMRTMRKGMPQSERFHGGRGEEIFGGMMDQEMSLAMAQKGGLGIARMVEDAVGARLDVRG
ncbi:MAG: rod-binding protein [Planctomycetes bacterium]|nr:rod-binding protein [Planctomycetota bacterium]